jgi:hypothetical protein
MCHLTAETTQDSAGGDSAANRERCLVHVFAADLGLVLFRFLLFAFWCVFASHNGMMAQMDFQSERLVSETAMPGMRSKDRSSEFRNCAI